MPLSRRTFLKTAAAGAAAATALGPRKAWATVSPEVPVLEIFCVGGFFHWLVGKPTGFGGSSPAWRTLSPGPNWTTIAGSDAYRPAASGPWPITSAGVEWSEVTAPLFISGLNARTRYAAVGHAVEAHEPAIVHALTGSKLGRARAASLGTVINHAMSQLYGDDIYSIVLETGPNANTYVGRAASAFGLWGPTYAPVVVPTFNAGVLSAFQSTLARPYRTRTDSIKELYRDRYNTSLVHSADGRVRAASFDAYSGALDQLVDHAALASVLSSAPLTWAPTAFDFKDNSTRGAIRYGVDLLRATNLRHVAVLDHGVGGDYDGHNDRAPEQAAGNLWNVFRTLAQLHAIQPLTDILVVVHSEFSRVQFDSTLTGTEHWPWASAAFFIGGPITAAGMSGDYAMSSGPAMPYVDGYPGLGPYHSPTDIRAVCAWAAGITDPLNSTDPYFDDDLAVSIPDEMFSSSATSAAATETVANDVLGI